MSKTFNTVLVWIILFASSITSAGEEASGVEQGSGEVFAEEQCDNFASYELERMSGNAPEFEDAINDIRTVMSRRISNPERYVEIFVKTTLSIRKYIQGGLVAETAGLKAHGECVRAFLNQEEPKEMYIGLV